ncbi:MAG: AraC family transcriptional regulator [Planctomycetota bacterium]
MEALLRDMEKMLKPRRRRTRPPPVPNLAAAEVPPERVSRYAVPSRAQERVGLWVSSVGRHVNQGPQTHVRGRVMDCYAAVWIARGEGWYESAASGRRKVGADTVMCVAPGVAHSYSADPAGWDEHWVVFGGRLAEELERQGYFSARTPLIATGGDPRVEGLFERLLATFLRGGPLSDATAAAMMHELLVVLHGLASGLDRVGAAPSSRVDDALRLIEREALRGLTPEGLAERLHTGYSTLRREFRRSTGGTIKEYLLRVKFRRAKELLAADDLNVEQVARACGFEDPLYFSRAFHARIGLWPTEFRASQRR